MADRGIKRKHDNGSPGTQPLTDMEMLEKAKQIMKQVTDDLDQETMMHKDISLKIKQMNEVNGKKATIGIFGKSGEGKSFLLSAILGEKDLLPSGCFGACTSIVTQVEANLSDSNYTAEIEFISKEEWEAELHDILKVLSDKSEDRNEDMIEIAREKITALYGEDADEKALEELKNHVTYAKIDDFLSSNKKLISTIDVREFIDEVSSYITHSESSSGDWYWPIVKSVTFKIPDCQDLLEHIILVDIPGTGDCNKSRDDLWKSKLKECSFVWIVSAINRVITDKDPWGILKHCIEELGPGGECKRINFICTKSDDINPSGYIRSARLTEYKCLGDKKQKKACILHRNENAKTRVKEKFESSEIQKKFSSDDDFLQVFTVSSSAFFDENLNLEKSETEIPKLREAVKIINKSINKELARDYINEAKGILSLIQSVQLDVDKELVEMKDNVHKEFKNNLTKALSELNSCFDSMYNDLEKSLSAGVDESMELCTLSTWTMISPNKGRGFHKTLEALCKNRGCYWSKAWDTILDLNKELAKHLHESIEKDFNMIFSLSGKTGRSVKEQIDSFSIIQSESSTYPMSTILHHIQNFIKTEENTLKTSLKKYITDEKKDIYSSILTTIKNKMNDCYAVAAEERGTGSMKRRQDLIIDTVNLLKNDMFNEAKMEVLKKFKKLKLYIKDTLENELKESMKLALSQTNNTTNTNNIKVIDVSREYEELEGLIEQLSE